MPKTFFFAREPFVLCFRIPPAAKRLWIRVGYHEFPSKIFCLTMPESFVGEKFCAVFQKRSGSEKLDG